MYKDPRAKGPYQGPMNSTLEGGGCQESRKANRGAERHIGVSHNRCITVRHLSGLPTLQRLEDLPPHFLTEILDFRRTRSKPGVLRPVGLWACGPVGSSSSLSCQP